MIFSLSHVLSTNMKRPSAVHVGLDWCIRGATCANVSLTGCLMFVSILTTVNANADNRRAQHSSITLNVLPVSVGY